MAAGETRDEEGWEIARRGIQMVLNNHYAEAQELFRDHEESIQLAAGHCFVVFMNALMTFEDDMLGEAMAALRDIEHRCAQDIGWIKTVRNKVFGSPEKDEAARLEEQIILADSQVCIALLTFLQQDVSGYMRGGWVLRKAWKVYQHTYQQILQLYRRTFGFDQNVPGSDFPLWRVVTRSTGRTPVQSPSCDWSVPNSTHTTPSCDATSPTSPNSGYPSVRRLNGFRNPFSAIFSVFSQETQNEVPPEVVSRLMAAVSFGYGVFQLCISLLPPSLLKLIQLLGFGGDRVSGLEALMFSRQGHDMRAPLATLALLWYHTIVRPFFALDGNNVQAGVEAASCLISESHQEFGDSALFLFFKGRIHRLQCDVKSALEVYQSGVEKSPQREVQLLCLHEVGWCHLIQLDWPQAYRSFLFLKQRSRWSKIFYTYLAAVSAGANEQTKESIQLAQEVKNISSVDHNTSNNSRSGVNQLEDFICRRANMITGQEPGFCRLLAYEMLFLWNALPSAQKINNIAQDCEQIKGDEPMVGLKLLLLGASQCCMGLKQEAVQSFRSVLSVRSHLPDTAEDSHVTAFALYELAVLLIKESQAAEEAKLLLERAQRDFKGYDFENRLNVRIHSALRNAFPS
ncbi:tetratricopeptide repeat protein 39C-like [Lycorma delicatula]|uniref:tetratricopeptide repeat protein 39C-like n=1 Tax=Lycorma delicatula TaxID=130591 RepID=UPI003F5134A5